jgi:hypothetical protein
MSSEQAKFKVDSLDIIRGASSIAKELKLPLYTTLNMIHNKELPGALLGGSDARCWTTSRSALKQYFDNLGMSK